MYSPSIAVGVSALNRGAVQSRGKDKHTTQVRSIGAGRIDVPFKLSPSANAQAASARTIAAIFMFVYVPRVLVMRDRAITPPIKELQVVTRLPLYACANSRAAGA